MKNTKIIKSAIVAAFAVISYSCTNNEYKSNTVKYFSVDTTAEARAAFDTTGLVRTARK